MRRPPLIALSWFAAIGLALAPLGSGQELRQHPTPLSVWLDFSSLFSAGARRPSLPIWLASVERDSPPPKAGQTRTTIFHLRFRRIGDLNAELQLRVFFNDRADARPTVSAWSETGVNRFSSGPLGSGIGLPSSQTLTVPMLNVDYVDVQVPGDGSDLRGIFATSLQKAEIRQARDFPSTEELADPFGQSVGAAPDVDDSHLFGRVQATIDPGVMKLSPREQPRGIWEFDLEGPPLLAMVSFEILNADSTALPEVIVNGRPLGIASILLPDLADPGYLGDLRSLGRDMRFRYTGWLTCQKAIPGSALQAGLNNVVLQLDRESGPIAIRAVVLQLKHNWQNLDYLVTPATP